MARAAIKNKVPIQERRLTRPVRPVRPPPAQPPELKLGPLPGDTSDTPVTDAYVKHLIDALNRFQAKTGMSNSKLSRELMGWQDFVVRFRGGGDVTLGKLRKLEAEIGRRAD